MTILDTIDNENKVISKDKYNPEKILNEDNIKPTKARSQSFIRETFVGQFKTTYTCLGR